MGSNRRYGEEAAKPSHEPVVPRVRHVLVKESSRADLDPYPGLVVSWRRQNDGWWALVAFVPAGSESLVVRWVAAGHLRPVGAA